MKGKVRWQETHEAVFTIDSEDVSGLDVSQHPDYPDTFIEGTRPELIWFEEGKS